MLTTDRRPTSGPIRTFWKFSNGHNSATRVIRSTSYLVLVWGFRGRRIERRHFRSVRCCIGAGQTRRVHSPDSSTFVYEMTSWSPCWKCDVKSKIRLRQSMCIWSESVWGRFRGGALCHQQQFRGVILNVSYARRGRLYVLVEDMCTMAHWRNNHGSCQISSRSDFEDGIAPTRKITTTTTIQQYQQRYEISSWSKNYLNYVRTGYLLVHV